MEIKERQGETMKQFAISKVVTRNFIMDIVARVQNFLGCNLTSYEKMVDKAVKQIWEELEEEGIQPQWFRYQTTQLTNGAVAVLCYGEKQ